MTEVPEYIDIADCAGSPEYFQDLQKWQNYSMVWQNRTFFFNDFVCKKIQYDSIKQQCESMESRLVLALGIFGFIGSLMSIMTFSRRQFVKTDVYLYRTVGVVECVHMAVMSFMHATSFFDCRASYICTFFSAHIYMTFSNLCAEMVEFIVVFLCVERTIACLAPQHFNRIHHIGVYRIAALLALVTSLPLNIVHSFDVEIAPEVEVENEHDYETAVTPTTGHETAANSKIQRYSEIPTWFASTSLYARILDAQLIRFCLVAPLIIVATAGSIIGLWQAVGRKRRLRGVAFTRSSRQSTFRRILQRRRASSADAASKFIDRNDSSTRRSMRNYSTAGHQTIVMSKNGSTTSTVAAAAAADRTRKEIKQMIDLCCLQLCLAVPIVINYLLCLAERAAKWNITLPDRPRIYEEAFKIAEYEDACAMLKRATVLEYLRFAISLTHMMAHGLHFYLYISFSAKFRQTLVEWTRIRKLGACSAAIRKRLHFIGRAERETTDGACDGDLDNDYEPVPTSTTCARGSQF